MKILIAAINSKYIHSSLVPWYLKAYCEDASISFCILESTINDDLQTVISRIYREKADVICFSCYIWNISYVLKAASTLKKILPDTLMVFGGPEVSYDSEKLMEENLFIDFVLSGEGERPLKGLLKSLLSGGTGLEDVEGLTYRKNGAILKNKSQKPIENLDEIPSPYSNEMISQLNGRIAYFESSRGCPFSCTYCLSSTDSGVRYFSMERVLKDLQRLIDAGVGQIKFVDRTFNCNKERANEIFRFIMECKKEINFHFETGADLFEDDTLEILEKMPPGRIQLEVGVQTTNPHVLGTVNRKMNMDKLRKNITRIREAGNIHLHLDLIAGLPGEDYNAFKRSFNDVYLMKPHQLQLGFLKFLKGTKMRDDAEKYDSIYNDYAPYEIVKSRDISPDELMRLKDIEDIVEKFYNSGRFTVSLEYLIDRLGVTPFDFYEMFSQYWLQKGYNVRRFPLAELYSILIDFISEQKEGLVKELKQLLKYDYLSTEANAVMPKSLKKEKDTASTEEVVSFLRNKENITKYLPDAVGCDPREIFRGVRIERFDDGTRILFDYRHKDKVTGRYRSIKLDDE